MPNLVLGENVPILKDVRYLVFGEGRRRQESNPGWKSGNALHFQVEKNLQKHSKLISRWKKTPKTFQMYKTEITNSGESGEMVFCILLMFTAVMQSNWIAVKSRNKQFNTSTDKNTNKQSNANTYKNTKEHKKSLILIFFYSLKI